MANKYRDIISNHLNNSFGYNPNNMNTAYTGNLPASGGAMNTYAPPQAPSVQAPSVQNIGGTGQNLGNGADPRGNAQVQATKALTDPNVEAVNQRIEVWNRRNTDQLSLKNVTPGMSEINPTEQLANPNVGFLDQDAMDRALSANPGQMNDMAVSSFDSRDFTEPVAPSMGQKLKGVKDKIGKENIQKGMAAGLSLIGNLQSMNQRNNNIKNLRGSVSDMEGAISGMAATRDANLDSLRENFSENRRKIGARSNMQLGQTLEKLNNPRSNLVSGSRQELIDDTVDTYQTGSDISIANAYEDMQSKETAFMDNYRNQYSNMSSQLSQLREQLESEKNAQAWAVPNMIADIGISALSVGNPLLGAGLRAAKQGLTDPYTT